MRVPGRAFPTGGATMTKAELVEEVSRVSDLTKKHSEVIVDAVFSSIVEALQHGDKIELRGFGRTPERPRGHVDSFETWFRDIIALREIAVRDFPGKKVFLLGESMGGLIAYDLAGRHPDRFAGVVLIAPAFKNGLKFPPSVYLKVALVRPFCPKHLVAAPFTSEMATRDPDYAAVMNANPDEVRVVSLGILAGFLPVQARARRLARSYAVPSLFLIPGVDHLVDETGSRKIFRKIALADKALIEYPEMFHAIAIDLGREKAFEDIVAWASPRV